MDVGQPEVSTAVTICQFLVVETQEVQHRGMQIVNVDLACHRFVRTAPTKRNLHERVRELSLEERDALARQGNLPERVALERRYGGAVWEGLLQNPQLTPREVCLMAKSGNLPPNLITLIVSNAGWLADSSIRSALLQNPRVSGTHLERLLRTASQAELRTIAEQTNVRMQVRSTAKRLIRR